MQDSFDVVNRSAQSNSDMAQQRNYSPAESERELPPQCGDLRIVWYLVPFPSVFSCSLVPDPFQFPWFPRFPRLCSGFVFSLVPPAGYATTGLLVWTGCRWLLTA